MRPATITSAAQEVFIILNPSAASGRAARLQQPLLAQLARKGLASALLVPDSPATARLMVDALPSGSRVIAIGGDGTVQNLLTSLLAGGHTLGLIPMGSGNDTARALGLARFGWRLALDHALEAEATCIDIGEARFEETANAISRHIVFISSLTAGFDSAVNLRAKAAPGWLSGMPRYLWATLGELIALRHWPLKVIADGELLHDGPGLFASTLNTRSFGGGMPAIPHARIDDGQLNLLLAGDIRLGQVLNLLPRLLVGWHLHRPQIQHRAFSKMRIESTLPIPLAADGEYLGQTHAVDVQVRAGSLMVIRGKN